MVKICKEYFCCWYLKLEMGRISTLIFLIVARWKLQLDPTIHSFTASVHVCPVCTDQDAPWFCPLGFNYTVKMTFCPFSLSSSIYTIYFITSLHCIHYYLLSQTRPWSRNGRSPRRLSFAIDAAQLWINVRKWTGMVHHYVSPPLLLIHLHPFHLPRVRLCLERSSY